MKNKVKRIINKLDDVMVHLCYRNILLVKIYYLLFSRDFNREMTSVLQGRAKYKADLSQGTCNVLLRRNIHRLEKGLIMIPRRDVFALAYIEETVSCLADCIESQSATQDEIKWSIDVLTEYFNVIKSEYVSGLKSIFIQIKTNYGLCDAPDKFKPYSHENINKSNIDYYQLLTLFKQRRSVRWFEQREVDVDLIEKAIDAATQAPSACNRQPFEYHLISGNERASDFAKCAMGTAGFADNIQCLIAVVGDLSAYPNERDRHVIYIDSSLFTMQFLLSLETLGLSSCVINWPDIEHNERKLGSKLKLESYKRVTMLVAVGYPASAGGVPFSQKKRSRDIIKEVV